MFCVMIQYASAQMQCAKYKGGLVFFQKATKEFIITNGHSNVFKPCLINNLFFFSNLGPTP